MVLTFTSCEKEETPFTLPGTSWRGRTSDYIYLLTFEEFYMWHSSSAMEGAVIYTRKGHYTFDGYNIEITRQTSSMHYKGVIEDDVMRLIDVPNKTELILYKEKRK